MVSMARIITIFVFVCLLFFFSCLSSELNKNHPEYTRCSVTAQSFHARARYGEKEL